MASLLGNPKISVTKNVENSIIFTTSLILFWLLVFSLVSTIASAYSISGREMGYIEGRKSDLFPEILRDEAVARLNELGKVSDADGYLERTFLSPASAKAGNLIRSWMEDAGLRTWVDLMGNVHGRADGMNTSAEALLIGSHLDTVIDAGIFDGSLGIVCAVSALKVLKKNEMLGKLRRPIEVIAFSDEEGVRFQSTFLGSAAIAGILPVSALHVSDKRGVTVQDVLKENSLEVTEENLYQLKYNAESIWGYVEVHIEQGPVLESRGLPLGVVKGIAGQTRLKVTVKGSQGHAGTVPMSMRQDPMAAAAELIVLLENLCKHPENFISYDGHCNGFIAESLAGSLVCTVGEISCWPSASNVIPGQAMMPSLLNLLLPLFLVAFTVDLRSLGLGIIRRRLTLLSISKEDLEGHSSNSPPISIRLDSCTESFTYALEITLKDGRTGSCGDMEALTRRKYDAGKWWLQCTPTPLARMVKSRRVCMRGDGIRGGASKLPRSSCKDKQVVNLGMAIDAHTTWPALIIKICQ
ncbi:hypothetical protein HHK36_023168 [Tetracentron sinense]|uniref:Allantoate deiminase n=1 Tax=Tetracentron sinense TaxID=13715 RepID=A0A834YKT0_TETSI|nr:hypothetical protein HHK36_023168 [Tetracentron sinense]